MKYPRFLFVSNQKKCLYTEMQQHPLSEISSKLYFVNKSIENKEMGLSGLHLTYDFHQYDLSHFSRHLTK